MRTIFTVLCLGIFTLSSATLWAEQKIVFAISAKNGTLQADSSQRFTEIVNKRLAGKVNVQFFDSAQLGKDKELMQRLKLRTVHIALPSSIMSNIAPNFGVFDLPFLVKDRQHVARIEKALLDSHLQPQIESKGYKVLAVWENGFRQITNNKRPINTPADLEGIKLRTPKSFWRVTMFKAYGSNPTPMAFPEVFVALQTGVIDGQENPLINIYSAKLNEVQKYLSLSGHVYSPAYPTMSKKFFDSLDAEVQKTFLEVAQEVALWSRKQGEKADSTLIEKLEAGGMEVNTADRASFVEASQVVYEKFSDQVPDGKYLVEAALKSAQ